MTMELTLIRQTLTDRSSVGELLVNGEHECWTLEDPTRTGEKVFGETAIPVGRYEVVINWSDRFKRLLPLLLNVPLFVGIRIHSGNKPKDTEGCILVGQNRLPDFIGNSRVAFDKLFPKLLTVFSQEKIFITVSISPTVVDLREEVA